MIKYWHAQKNYVKSAKTFILEDVINKPFINIEISNLVNMIWVNEIKI